MARTAKERPQEPAPSAELARIDEACAFLRAKSKRLRPRAGVVLGSGLGALVDAVEVSAAVPYHDIPGFPTSTVEGHAGRFVLGRLAGCPVAIMQGRVHLYEGYAVRDVVFPVRVLARLGAQSVVLTNAAGCVNPSWRERELMLIADHLNLSGTNALFGPNEAALGPRFPDMSEAYDAELRARARTAAARRGLLLREGVYAGLLGPTYETPAEVRMLRVLGADAVGMSTVNETIALRHMGVRVLGVSCLSNMAAGLAKAPLSHAEVKEAADLVQADFTALLSEVIGSL